MFNEGKEKLNGGEENVYRKRREGVIEEGRRMLKNGKRKKIEEGEESI